jgi:hypothetical protein
MNKKLIQQISERNTREYNLSKASEEMQELGLILTQYLNKPDKIDEQKIIDEIGDVAIRLNILKNIFPKEKIKERIKQKLNKYEEYIKSNTYRDI